MASDNVSLGMFNLTGIPPAPRGVPQIEVTFDIDANGILNVTAKDLATNNQQKIIITASTKLDEATKNRMIKEAEQFAEQDRLRKEEADLRNNADALLYTTEKTKKDLGDKIGKEDVERLDKAMAELRQALAGKDLGTIRTKTDQLGKVLQEVGAAAYQRVSGAQRAQSGPQPGSHQGSGPHQQGEKVVDADYRVVDGDKNKK
jgi:molecular chaperone DnaK